MNPLEVRPDSLTRQMVETLTDLFEYELRGPFVVARQDDEVLGVFGDWNGDGRGYWETCAHCYRPLMERAGETMP